MAFNACPQGVRLSKEKNMGLYVNRDTGLVCFISYILTRAKIAKTVTIWGKEVCQCEDVILGYPISKERDSLVP